MLGCMTDADIFVMELVHAFQLVTEWDERGIIAGYRLVMNAIGDLPSYLQTCETSGSDWKSFGLWFGNFIHPIQLVERITDNAVHNIPELSIDALKIRADLQSEEYFAFGEEIGEVAVLLTTPINTAFLQ